MLPLEELALKRMQVYIFYDLACFVLFNTLLRFHYVLQKNNFCLENEWALFYFDCLGVYGNFDVLLVNFLLEYLNNFGGGGLYL